MASRHQLMAPAFDCTFIGVGIRPISDLIDVLAGCETCPRRHTDRAIGVSIRETGATRGQPVKIWGLDDIMAGTTHGARLVLSSDLPGEPWTPMQTLYFAVTRQDLDASAPPWFPEQALSVDEALHAMTVEAAYAGFAEGRLGQLRPGAWADFVVLDVDPHAVAPAQLADIEVRETWVAGARLELAR